MSAATAEQFMPLQGAPTPAPMPGVLTGDLGAPTELPLSLDDAIRMGLNNSGVVRVLSGGTVAAAEATIYDAETAEARARAALAAFDPNLTSSYYANWINQPPDSVFGPGLAEPTRRDEAGFAAAVSKPWITGTETRVGYNPPLGYLYLPLGTSGFNPLYESNTEFTVRQPLLKGSGVAVNKAPIRIAHLRRDQTVLQTQQAAMASVRSITEAYWELYSASAALRSLEEVVPLLDRVVYIEKERMNAQRSVRADVAKVQSQFHAVMQQTVQARSAKVQRELVLRNLLGLPPVDGSIICPTSHPLEAPVTIDVSASTATAMELRPDLIRQRLLVRTREQELLAAKNLGLPQLDAVGLYRWNGVGERLDDSLDQMFGTQYSDWQTSLTLSVPLGRRAAAAGIRAATLQLSREKAMLQQATHSTSHLINSLVREAEYTYQLYAEAAARLQANVDWLEGAKIRYENPPPSGDDWLLAATNDYLTALRSQADAATDKQIYLARYNAVLARLHEAMGTILRDQSVQWSCDPATQQQPSRAMVEVPAAVPPNMNAPIQPPSVPTEQLPSAAAPNLPPSFPPQMPTLNVPSAPANDHMPGGGQSFVPLRPSFGPSPSIPVPAPSLPPPQNVAPPTMPSASLPMLVPAQGSRRYRYDAPMNGLPKVPSGGPVSLRTL